MTKKLLLLHFFLCIANIHFILAQTELPYFSDFESEQVEENWVQFQLGPEASGYTWNLSNIGTLDHYYPVGGMEETDDWFVSPAFNFGNGGMIDSISGTFFGFGLPFGIDTVALYLLEGSNNPSMAENKVLLKLFSDSTYMNDMVERTYYDIPIPVTTDTAYIAFRYKTIINWLDVRFDDLQISAVPPLLAIDFIETDLLQVEIAPNPSNGIIRIDAPLMKGTEALIYDIRGALVHQISLNSDIVTLDLSHLNTGLYYLKITGMSECYLVRSFMIE